MARAPHDTCPFHEGELAVQTAAGARASAERTGGIVQSAIPPAHLQFLAGARVVAVGGIDRSGRVWATLLVGQPGMIEGSPSRVRVHALPSASDALRDVLGPRDSARAGGSPCAVGLTIIDFTTRRRVRVNGMLVRGDASEQEANVFCVAVEEAYQNCPKYIQSRAPAIRAGERDGTGRSGNRLVEHRGLSDAHRAWLARADTAFIASVGPAGRVDVSHRGGSPGFLVAVGKRRVLLPDYAGNSMFNTLGNLHLDPRAALVVPDFDAGGLLQLGGTAGIDWRPDVAAALPGAERVVVFDVERVREVADAIPRGWSPPAPSPFNPTGFARGLVEATRR